jgi:hypothetical protein
MLRPTKPFQIFQKERADLKFSESDERLSMRTFDSQQKLAMYDTGKYMHIGREHGCVELTYRHPHSRPLQIKN